MSAHDPQRTLRQPTSGGVTSLQGQLGALSGASRASVRGWTRSVVGLKFCRHETLWSPAVTHEHALAGPEFGDPAASQCFHMHKNVGRLGTTG